MLFIPSQIDLMQISAVILLIATFGIVVRRGFLDWLGAYRYQTFIVSGITALVASITGICELYIASALTLVIKAIVIPKILVHVTEKLDSPIRFEIDPYLSLRSSVIVAALLVALSYFVVSQITIKADNVVDVFLPVSLSLFLIGLFVIISRRKILNQVVGLLTIENGLFLFAVALTHGFSLLIELGILADILVGVVIAGILLSRISKTFDSIDIRNLENLRDD